MVEIKMSAARAKVLAEADDKVASDYWFFDDRDNTLCLYEDKAPVDEILRDICKHLQERLIEEQFYQNHSKDKKIYAPKIRGLRSTIKFLTYWTPEVEQSKKVRINLSPNRARAVECFREDFLNNGIQVKKSGLYGTKEAYEKFYRYFDQTRGQDKWRVNGEVVFKYLTKTTLSMLQVIYS